MKKQTERYFSILCSTLIKMFIEKENPSEVKEWPREKEHTYMFPLRSLFCPVDGGSSIFLKEKVHPDPRVSLPQGRLVQLKRTPRKA